MRISSGIFFTILFLSAACKNSTYNFQATGTTPISTYDVEEVDCALIQGRIQIIGRTFSPSSETIFQNDVVMWENNDSDVHTVTSGTTSAEENVFDMTINPGQERCLRFKRTKSYSYFCKIHPQMRGAILVR